MSQTIEVLYMVNRTTKKDAFTATSSSVTMLEEATSISFTDGKFDGRSVESATYRHAERVIRYEQ